MSYAVKFIKNKHIFVSCALLNVHVASVQRHMPHGNVQVNCVHILHYLKLTYPHFIVRFTKFVASIFRDFFKSTEHNVTKYTSFERSFNIDTENAIPAENNLLLPKFSAEMTVSHIKNRLFLSILEQSILSYREFNRLLIIRQQNGKMTQRFYKADVHSSPPLSFTKNV